MNTPGAPADADYQRQLGARLRHVRQSLGLSLFAVEEKSGGVWKAVVIGSYERGDRAITVARLSSLAAFYGVPVPSLLPGGQDITPLSPAELVAQHLREALELLEGASA